MTKSDDLLRLELVKTCPDSLSRMASPSLPVIRAAVETDGNAIRHVDPRWLGKGSAPAEKELEDLRLAAVRHNGFAIRHIDRPSLQARLEAVRQDPMALEFIRHRPRAVVLEAISRNPSSVRFLSRVPDWARRLIENSTGNWVEFYLAA